MPPWGTGGTAPGVETGGAGCPVADGEVLGELGDARKPKLCPDPAAPLPMVRLQLAHGAAGLGVGLAGQAMQSGDHLCVTSCAQF
jgi:hypothetical protein